MTSLLVSLALAGAEPASLTPPVVPRARRVALLVGVAEYDDPQLEGGVRFAGKDAVDLGGALRDPARGRFDAVIVLSGKVGRAEVLDALRATIAGLDEDDLFVFYYSGHALTVPERSERGAPLTALYLLPSDARMAQAASTGLAWEEIRRQIAALRARGTVTIIDSCRTLPKVGRGAPALDGRALATRIDAALYATSALYPSYEYAELENGVYTHFLVEALGARDSGRFVADFDGDGIVSVDEAHGYAASLTAERTGGEQQPHSVFSREGLGTLVLSGTLAPGARPRSAFAVPPSRALRQGELRIDGRGVRGGEVEPGIRRLTIDGELAVPVFFTRGQHIPVDAIERDRAASWEVGGSALVARQDLVSPVSLGAEAHWLPADYRGVRPVLGLAGHYGVGEVGPLGTFPNGDLAVTGALLAGPTAFVAGRPLDVLIGPAASLGAELRRPATLTQVTPVVGASAELRLSWGPVWAEAGIGARGLIVDRALEVHPAGVLAAGVRVFPEGVR